jgi:hypothetical protein
VNDTIARLATRIREEAEDIEGVTKRMEEGWRRFRVSGDDYYLDGVALNLHGFYSGLERIFELVAEVVDGKVPKGENWHQMLLEQMANDVPPVRPAVISEPVFKRLNEFRGFRHIVRNVYTYKFDPEKVKKLVKEAPRLYLQVRQELLAYAEFLEQAS